MHSLLARLLEKRGYKHVSELPNDLMPDGSPSERQTFEHWNRILSTNTEITVENIAKFCDAQLKDIKAQMRNLDNSTTKNDRLVLLHSVYDAIHQATQAPQTEREALEKYLTGLLNSP